MIMVAIGSHYEPQEDQRLVRAGSRQTHTAPKLLGRVYSALYPSCKPLSRCPALPLAKMVCKMGPHFEMAHTQIKDQVCSSPLLSPLLHLSFLPCAGTLSISLVRAGRRVASLCQEQFIKLMEKSKNIKLNNRVVGLGVFIIIQLEAWHWLLPHQKDGLTISQSRVTTCSPFAMSVSDKSRNNLCRDHCLVREHRLESSALISSFCL